MLRSTVKALLKAQGYEIHRIPRPRPSPLPHAPKFAKIHYACGYTYLPGWLNVDIMPNGPNNYLYVDLVSQHPFPDNVFEFGFSEDFIEHVPQADSLLFLLEAHRTLKPGGVLRLTFPGFDRVLNKHFRKKQFAGFLRGKVEAYSSLGHIHFYSAESLTTVAHHLGFSIEFVDSGRSKHEQLRNLNTRDADVNLHVELTKL